MVDRQISSNDKKVRRKIKSSLIHTAEIFYMTTIVAWVVCTIIYFNIYWFLMSCLLIIGFGFHIAYWRYET